jgi:hypothetical protein
MTLKLFLFFIAFDILVLMAYPFAFVLDKLRQFSKFIVNRTPMNM